MIYSSDKKNNLNLVPFHYFKTDRFGPHGNSFDTSALLRTVTLCVSKIHKAIYKPLAKIPAGI